MNRLHRKVGVKQLPNGLRHSYISYRLTLNGDVNRTPLEAGKSTNVIHSNYHALMAAAARLVECWAQRFAREAMKDSYQISIGAKKADAVW